jgi:glycosyltransferase involved in cell wall biosynthesis
MSTRAKELNSPWIVCIGGEDWWYHSHAHFDIQVMKRMSRRCRVLYVCSIGMRMPSLRRDAQFWNRIRNKLRSVARNLRQVDGRLWVYSPLPLPFYQSALGRHANAAVLAVQLRAVFGRLEIDRPLFWVNTPTGWPVVRTLGRRGLVYQRTDEYASYKFDNFNADYVRTVDEELLRRADLVLHVDHDLHARTQARTRRAVLMEQGVDERFFESSSEGPPADMPVACGPVVGYVGTLESHKFNAELVRNTACQLPDCSFVIVGPYHQNADCLRGLPNVHFLGARPHDQILRYVRAFDVCMLPTAKTTWGLHCKPIKLMEYLAMDRPVVATDTPAADQFRDCVHIADASDGWVEAIRGILRGERKRAPMARERLAACTWNRQVDRIWSELAGCGLLDSDGTREPSLWVQEGGRDACPSRCDPSTPITAATPA